MIYILYGREDKKIIYSQSLVAIFSLHFSLLLLFFCFFSLFYYIRYKNIILKFFTIFCIKYTIYACINICIYNIIHSEKYMLVGGQRGEIFKKLLHRKRETERERERERQRGKEKSKCESEILRESLDTGVVIKEPLIYLLAVRERERESKRKKKMLIFSSCTKYLHRFKGEKLWLGNRISCKIQRERKRERVKRRERAKIIIPKLVKSALKTLNKKDTLYTIQYSYT